MCFVKAFCYQEIVSRHDCNFGQASKGAQISLEILKNIDTQVNGILANCPCINDGNMLRFVFNLLRALIYGNYCKEQKGAFSI